MYRDILPKFLRESSLYRAVLDSWQIEVDKCNGELDDFFLQLIPTKATWTLPYWETLIGITHARSLTNEARREVIVSRLRGTGTASKSMIESMAAAFSGGLVEIIEDANSYSFKVKFVGVHGIPLNLAGLTEAIEIVKPAHLVFDYEYTFMTWDAHDAYNMTLDEWDALNLKLDEFETYQQ